MNYFEGVRKLIITIVFHRKSGEDQIKDNIRRNRVVLGLELREDQKKVLCRIWLDFGLNAGERQNND